MLCFSVILCCRAFLANECLGPGPQFHGYPFRLGLHDAGYPSLQEANAEPACAITISSCSYIATRQMQPCQTQCCDVFPLHAEYEGPEPQLLGQLGRILYGVGVVAAWPCMWNFALVLIPVSKALCSGCPCVACLGVCAYANVHGTT